MGRPDDPSKEQWDVLAFSRFLSSRRRGATLLVSSFDDQTWRKLIRPVELILVKFGRQSCSLTGRPPGTLRSESGKTQGRPIVFRSGTVRGEWVAPPGFELITQTWPHPSVMQGMAGML